MNDARDDTTGGPRAAGPHADRTGALLPSSLWAIGGMGCYHACHLGVLVLLAKLTTPEIQGQYFLALAIATPILLLFGLELRPAFVSDAAGQFTLGTYRVVRRGALGLGAVVLAGAFLWQSQREARPVYLLILAGVFAARFLWTQAEFGWGTYQRRERLDLLAVAVGLRGLTLLLPFAVLLPTWRRLSGPGHAEPQQLAGAVAAALALHAAGLALIWLIFDRPRVLDRRRWDLSWTPAAAWSLAWQTLPLGAVALLINLCDAVPRLLFEHPAVPDGKTQLGYFGALAFITLAGNLIIIQAATAAANRLAVYYQNDVRAFVRLGLKLLAAAAVIGGGVLLAAVLAGRWLLAAIYTPDHARFQAEFVLIVAAHALALLTNVFGAATTQMRLFWVQVPVQVVTLGATLAAAWLLIPGPTPVRGAALTALVRAGVQLVLYAACVVLGLARRRRCVPRTEDRATQRAAPGN